MPAPSCDQRTILRTIAERAPALGATGSTAAPLRCELARQEHCSPRCVAWKFTLQIVSWSGSKTYVDQREIDILGKGHACEARTRVHRASILYGQSFAITGNSKSVNASGIRRCIGADAFGRLMAPYTRLAAFDDSRTGGYLASHRPAPLRRLISTQPAILALKQASEASFSVVTRSVRSSKTIGEDFGYTPTRKP